jgi:hypothetical protein
MLHAAAAPRHVRSTNRGRRRLIRGKITRVVWFLGAVAAVASCGGSLHDTGGPDSTDAGMQDERAIPNGLGVTDSGASEALCTGPCAVASGVDASTDGAPQHPSESALCAVRSGPLDAAASSEPAIWCNASQSCVQVNGSWACGTLPPLPIICALPNERDAG